MRIRLTSDNGNVLYHFDNIKGVLSLDAAIDGIRVAYHDERRNRIRDAVEHSGYGRVIVTGKGAFVRDGKTHQDTPTYVSVDRALDSDGPADRYLPSDLTEIIEETYGFIAEIDSWL